MGGDWVMSARVMVLTTVSRSGLGLAGLNEFPQQQVV
jgi:hypothetical protein